MGRPQRPLGHQTITLLDWDDTMLCTSSLDLCTSSCGLKQYFEDMAKFGRELLSKALSAGQVFIITNAKEGWVQQSASRYLPELVPLLRKVRVISARSRFGELFPRHMDQWKTLAFLEVQQHLDPEAIA